LDALQLILSQQPQCHCLVLTGYGTIPLATQAMRLGACEVLTKPVGFELILNALTQSQCGIHTDAWESETLFEHQRAYIDYILLKTGNNISETARILGMHRQSLQRILRKRIT
jgi:two-component system response regulator RegA